MQYRGLAVRGFTGLPSTEDLLAVWKTSEGQRFQNYRAVFTRDIVNILTTAGLNTVEVVREKLENEFAIRKSTFPTKNGPGAK